jgi:prevent-host-death family protein
MGLTRYLTSHIEAPFMPNWPVQDAKARFSELLETCIERGPQIVTKRGQEAAVLVPIAEWRRLTAASGASIKEWLLAEGPSGDMNIPPRTAWRTRRAPDLD